MHTTSARMLNILVFMTLVGIITGCKTNTMSVQQAQDVAIEFQETYKTVPPRGLGEMIERAVAYYKDPPNVPAEFSVPRRKFTDAELNDLYRGVKKQNVWGEPRFYATRAYDEFLLANLSLSIRLVNLIYPKSTYVVDKADAFAYKALFLAEAGDYKGADKALSAANRFFGEYRSVTKQTPFHQRYLLAQAVITRARAATYFARGDIQAAENEFRQLIRDIDKARQHQKHVIMGNKFEPEARMYLARVLMVQGRLSEAEVYIREAIRFNHIRLQPYCYLVLSNIFFERGRFQDASVCARTGLHIAMSQRTPIDSFIRANARAVYGRTLFALGQYERSLQQFNLIEEELKTDPETFNRRFKGSPEWGLALLLNGDAEAAIEKFEFAARLSEKISGVGTYALTELRALRAMALSQSGKNNAARQLFDTNVPMLLKKWEDKEEGINSQNARSFKLKLIVEAYLALLSESGNTEDAEISFQYASALQDKLIGKAVGLSAARAAVKDLELADLIRQRQDLDLKHTALKNRLTNALYAPPELINNEVLSELKNQIMTINLASETLGKEIKHRFPEYANIVNPDIVDVSTVRSKLDNTEALISIFSGNRYTFVWAIPKTGPVALAKVPIGKAMLANKVGNLRKALNPGEVFGVLELPEFDQVLAHDLYAQTLKPVEKGWQQAKHLMVITQGPMGQIPLSILPTKGKFKTEVAPGEPAFSNYREVDWLVKTHSVTVLPSVSALINLRSIVPQQTERGAYVGFGDPYFNQEQLAEAEEETTKQSQMLAMRNSPIQMRGIRVTEAGRIDKKKIASIDISMLKRLPDTREEVINIAATLKADTEQDVFIGKQASERTVKSLKLSNRKVVVFATHGLVPGDLDGLDQPALALSAPDVTGNEDEDGLLTMGEIMGLRLNADWVVLSACNTGAAEGEGAEAVSGLGQAFFYAGARSLLVTGWPVETVSAKLLTTDLFKRQLENPDINRSEALRQTMNAMILKNHNQGFSYAHPIFWAPYAIVGDGRR